MNKRGFSMIELLATITILGVLVTVAIGSVSLILKKGRENYYQSQRNNLIGAAKSYYQSNRSLLPKDLGDTGTVTLKALNDNKFIDKVLSSDKKTPCNPDDTKVVVTKTDNNKYKYKSYLKCNGIDDEVSANTSNANFDVEPVRIEQTGPLTYALHVWDKNNEVKIKHYTYTVTKNNYHFFGPVSDNVNAKDINTRTFQIDEESNNKDNNFSVTVKILDEKGVNHTYSRYLYIGDNRPPTCTLSYNSLTAWANVNSQTLKFKCEDPKVDGYSSGCNADNYKIVLNKKNLLTRGKNFRIYDKAGNSSVCDVENNILLDYEPPTCPTVKGYLKSSVTDISSNSGLPEHPSNTWSNKWLLTVASGSIDKAYGKIGKGANNVYYKVTVTGASSNVNGLKQGFRNVNAEGVSTVSYEACDSLNNCTTNCNAKYIAKLDRTPPTNLSVTAYKKNNATNLTSKGNLTSTVASGVWSNKYLFIVAGGATDSVSGEVYYKSKLGNSNYSNVGYQNDNVEGTNYYYFIACDAAGNCHANATAYTAKVDVTAPVVNISTSNGGYDVTGSGSDYGSGLAGYKWTGDDNWRGASGNTISQSTHAATSNGKYTFYLLDAAGNSNSRTTNNAYVNCSSTYVPEKKKDYPDCTTKYANISLYKWSYKSKSCNGSDKKRTYDFKQYSCICTMDNKTGQACSGTIENVTSCYHGSDYSIIHYQNNNNGKKACDADNMPVNSYTTRVCKSDDYSVSSGSVYDYHGYRFYEGEVEDWNGFSSGWTSGSKNRPPSNYSAADACIYACDVKY